MTKRELGPRATGDTPREQRLAAAGRVAAGLLHEFRNVLGPIANIAFLLEHQAGDPAKVKELARRLAAQAAIRGRVAERLLDFVRQDAERFPDGATADLAAMAREVLAACTPLVSGEQPVTLTCECDAALPVAGDAVALRTALLELVLNALDAVAAKGGAIQVVAAVHGNTARVQVIDTGVGLPGGVEEFVYDPFISSRNDPDAGLGLSAAWGIVRRHGGALQLDRLPDGGTVATLTLPLLPSRN